MKTAGLLGGMSWESTLVYCQAINEGIRTKLGGWHSAQILLYSVDFHEIEHLQHQGKWYEIGLILCQAAQKVENAGADFLVICTNTMHKVAPQVESSIGIPILHIVDATAERIRIYGNKTVGLLGTKHTMEQDFYKLRLLERHGITAIIPRQDDRDIVNKVIYEELCVGKLVQESKNEFLRIINDLAQSGAEAVILGCTEIGILIKQRDTPVRLLDTTRIHAEEAVKRMLS